MPLDFPNSPSNGDTYNAGGKTWSYNGSVWVLVGVSVSATPEDGSITTAKIAAGAVTAAKLGNDISLTPANGSITQAKLASNVSGITLTTTANRSTDIPSPFTAQFIFLTDTNTLQRWSGSAWTNVLASPPGAPTSLSATALSTTLVSVAFTPGASAGASTTNYKYALSTDGGAAYGEPTALDPADFTSPITISGLNIGTTYHIKLKAVTDVGDSEFSSAVSVTTVPALTVDYLVVAGGGGGGWDVGGGGGAGGMLTSTFTPAAVTNYSTSVGSGGVGATSGSVRGSSGTNSSFNAVTAIGGGGAGNWNGAGGVVTSGIDGGSGGGAGGWSIPANALGGNPTSGQGYKGGDNTARTANAPGGGGGGAGGAGANSVTKANIVDSSAGGVGLASSITGSSITYATGGRGGNDQSPASLNATANTGNGGDGGGISNPNGAADLGYTGGSGVVILRYPSFYTITLGAGLTGSTTTVSSNKVTTITAGSGNVSWA